MTISFIWSTFDLQAGGCRFCLFLFFFLNLKKRGTCGRDSLDLLLQCRLEELEQQVLLPLVGGIVVQREDHRVHELCGFILGHLENELGQVGRVGLQGDKRVSRDEFRCPRSF